MRPLTASPSIFVHAPLCCKVTCMPTPTALANPCSVCCNLFAIVCAYICLYFFGLQTVLYRSSCTVMPFYFCLVKKSNRLNIHTNCWLPKPQMVPFVVQLGSYCTLLCGSHCVPHSKPKPFQAIRPCFFMMTLASLRCLLIQTSLWSRSSQME